MPATMTSTIRAQGSKNGLLILTVILPTVALITTGVWRWTGKSFLEAFLLVSFTTSIVSFLLFLVFWLRDRLEAGELLLDCGSHPFRKIFVFNALIFLVVGLTTWRSSIPYLWIAFGVSIALSNLLMAGSRLQCRTEGVWIYWGLLRWKKIRSYEWVANSTLLVKSSGFFARRFISAVVIPPDHREAFKLLLKQYCPVTVEANAPA
ncbi:MAG: hypothetical protein NVSMB14_16320 [Isosphaeraceae bacterium]